MYKTNCLFDTNSSATTPLGLRLALFPFDPATHQTDNSLNPTKTPATASDNCAVRAVDYSFPSQQHMKRFGQLVPHFDIIVNKV